MFDQIFLSPPVKRWAIITYKDSIYELPHELPNDCPVPSQNEGFVNTSRNLLENRNETFPVVRYFTWKLESVSDIL